MEVAGVVFAALGFLSQAVDTSVFLSKLAHDASEIGTKLVSATTRLNAQRLALQLWHEKWSNKVGHTHETSITAANREILYQRIWGFDGYKMIMQCLAQLSIKMGEASRTLSLIDPDSLGGIEKTSPLIDPETSIGTKMESRAHQKMSFRHFLRQSSGKNATKPRFPKLWHRHSNLSDAARSSVPDTESKKALYTQSSVEEEARTQAEALRLQLGPGTKFKWSIVLKDELGSILQEIDDWLIRVQTLSDRCGELRDHADEHPSMNHSSIRAAARALYLALPDRLRLPVAPRIDLKLERERVNTKYFNRNFGGITYVDRINTSFKFPILITDTTAVNSRFFLVAEAINSKMANTIPDNIRHFEEEAVIEDLLASLSRADMAPDSPSVIISHLENTNPIVVHAVPEHNKNIKPLLSAPNCVPCTFYDVLEAQPKINTYVAGWKRLQLACTIATSVLHLRATGWMPRHLESNAFHFFGPPQHQLDDTSGTSLFISPSTQSVTQKLKTPFDCLRRTTVTQTLFSEPEEEASTLIHQLGILLFELGRGGRYSTFFSNEFPTTVPSIDSLGNVQSSSKLLWEKSLVLAEIEKIEFGRSYRELVTSCLSGSLYYDVTTDVETHLDGKIVQKLLDLEKHFSAILS